MRLLGLALCVLCCLASATPTFASPVYTFTNLGTLPGTNMSYGMDLNDAGQVVGYTHSGDHPWVWTQSGGMVQLSIPANKTTGYALANNSSGHIVGYADSSPSVRQALRWDSSLGMSTMAGSVAFDINDLGQVVGWGGYSSAWLWDPVGGFTSLVAPSGYSSPGATALNEAGQVVGGLYNNNTRMSTSYIWDATNGMRDLAVLTGITGSYITASDINASGVVAGSYMDAQSRYQPFVWSEVNGLTLLDAGTLGGTAEAINDSGWVVGRLMGGGNRAALWENGSVHQLSTLLESPGNIYMEIAYGINNHGDITGYGSYGAGYSRAFYLWNIPEPSSLALMGFGIGALVMRRRRRAA